MFIAGKCGAVKNVTMASHSSLFQTLVLQLNATIIGFMGRGKEEYTALLFIHLPARGRDALVRVSPIQCSVHITDAKDPSLAIRKSGAWDINWCPG